MVCIQFDVYTVWCVYSVMCIQYGVYTVWCVYSVVCIQRGVYTVWCVYNMVCLQCDVYTVWCVYSVVCIQFDFSISDSFLGALLRNSEKRPLILSCPSVRMYQSGYHWTELLLYPILSHL
jgi:hypothetical protein